MTCPVFYRGHLDVRPALTPDHAKLIDALMQLKEDELTRPIFAAIRASDVPVLPYYGDQIYVTEDGSRIEASDDEQGVGLGRWLVLLLEHVFQPLGYTVNGEIEWDGADDLQDRGSFYVKDNVLEVIDAVIFTPGPSLGT